MNSEDKIYNKLKNASYKGEKDFPGMDKVWNRVEEKLDNTIVVQKKNTWQKLAIAATILLSFSIIYQFVGNEETFKGKIKSNEANPVIVSNDSVKKIMEKAKEVIVENEKLKKTETDVNAYYKSEITSIENKYLEMESPQFKLEDTAKKMEFKFDDNFDLENKDKNTTELNKAFFNTNNEISMRNSATNFVSSNSSNGILAPSKKYDVATKVPKSKYKSKKSKTVKVVPVEQNKELIVIDGVVTDKEELETLSAEEIADSTYLPNPLYIINGIEYSEESLFGKNPTSPYAPLDKQKITSTNILKPADATKIYGKKGEKGIVIITTKDGKPAEK